MIARLIGGANPVVSFKLVYLDADGAIHTIVLREKESIKDELRRIKASERMFNDFYIIVRSSEGIRKLITAAIDALVSLVVRFKTKVVSVSGSISNLDAIKATNSDPARSIYLLITLKASKPQSSSDGV